MTRFFKGLGLLVAVACFTWVAVLWRWQSTQRDMSVQDIGVYLVALPLTLFALVLLARWAWQGASQQPVPQAAAAAPAAPAAPAEDPARLASVQLLTAQVNCAAGSDAAAVLQALADGGPRPQLDDELRDDQGLPLMAARIGDLDVDAPGLDGVTARPELLRALAALAPALDAALAALRPWQARFATEGAAPKSMLRLLPAWPADLTPEEAARATAWLRLRVQDSQLVPDAALSLLPASAPGQHWADAERTLRLLERDQRADVLLLTACHSALGPAAVARLQSARALYTTATPKLPIAGEGAAVLAVAPAAWPADPDADTPPLRVHRAAVALRDKPIDDAGRTSPAVAERCLQQALAGGPFQAEQVAFAVHDADQHTARAPEALTALLAAQPHLQAGDDILGSGALTGQLGPVAPLFVTALAAEQARRLERPCLALSVDDARLRMAVVVRPATFDPAAPAAA